MKAAFTLEAKKREQTGRGEARALRRSGEIPAILYSKKLEPISLAVNENAITREYKKGGFRSRLMELKLDGKSYYALARDVQLHPVSDRIEHADFLQVEADSNVHVFVPVKVLNADRCMGVRKGGALNIVRHSIEMICKPDSIPAAIEIDVTNYNIGDSVHISSVELPKGVTPAIKDRDFTIITVAGRLKADDVIPEGAPVAAGEVPATTAKAPAAGAAPAADAKGAKAPAKK